MLLLLSCRNIVYHIVSWCHKLFSSHHSVTVECTENSISSLIDLQPKLMILNVINLSPKIAIFTQLFLLAAIIGLFVMTGTSLLFNDMIKINCKRHQIFS